MNWRERGFTLVETMMAFLVFGVLTAFAVPLCRELNLQLHEQQMEMEMVRILEHKMESLASDAGMAGSGAERLPGRTEGSGSYHVHWRAVEIEPRLYEVWVEVKGKDRGGKIHKKRWVTHRLSKRGDDAGFTYVELMIAFMLLLLLLPALFFIAHAFETNLKTFVGQQELQLEYMAFRPLVERDIAQAIHIATMEGGVLELIHPDGKAVRYQTSNRQVIRRVKEAGANRFSGATVVLRHVYYMGFHPERRGVRLDMGLQNWLADLDIKIFIAGRMGVHHAADR